eukprot:maker-scaffold483_size159862-snap-gene-0.44 protein:Tk08701 transcript:maker-scaffold483_size159862-snap-gene-0.44-mRNA-1 annotation:"hypothetical protein LOTGIDRAFT_169106"
MHYWPVSDLGEVEPMTAESTTTMGYVARTSSNGLISHPEAESGVGVKWKRRPASSALTLYNVHNPFLWIGV